MGDLRSEKGNSQVVEEEQKEAQVAGKSHCPLPPPRLGDSGRRGRGAPPPPRQALTSNPSNPMLCPKPQALW